MLTAIDWIIMVVYFVFVLGIGVALKRYMKTSSDFFLAGRSITAWVAGLAFMSANLGAWGLVMLAFGLIMLWLGRRKPRSSAR